MHVAIEAVYCHYMLAPCMECLWYSLSVDRINNHRTSYGAKDKCFSVQQMRVYPAITYIVRKN